MSDAGEFATRLGLKPPAKDFAARLGLKPPAEQKDIPSVPREEQAAGPGGFSADTGVPGWLQSLLGGVTHGLGNVIHGGARIGARIGEATETPSGPELPKGTTERVDTTAQKREETYQASPERRAHSIIAGAGEFAGEAAGTAAEMGPLAGVAGAPGWMGKLLGGAAVGAAASLATPRGDESMEPSAQLQRGGAGAVGGAAGVAVPAAAGKLVSALVGHDEKAIGEATTKAFRTLIKPGRGQRTRGTQLDTQDRQVLDSLDDIIKSRKDLAAVTGGQPQYPGSLREYVDALGENGKTIFQQYDTMAKDASGELSNQHNPHLVPAFQETGVMAQQAQNAVREANQAVTMSAAATSRAGSNVYQSGIAMPAQRQAQQRLAQARAQADRATQVHEAVKARMYKPFVDLQPIVNRLNGMTREASFADLAPSVAADIRAQAERLQKRGFYGLTETQDVIQSLNAKLDSFYRNPTPSEASRVVADAEMAGMLRTQLDETIEKLTGPGYAALKKRYGANRETEKAVVAAYQREANKIPGGIGGIFADLWTTAHGLKAVGTLDAHALATALASKGAKFIMNKLRDPNRAVQRLFAQRAYEPGQAQRIIGGLSRSVPPVGALPGGLAGSRAAPPPGEPPKREIRPSAIGG